MNIGTVMLDLVECLRSEIEKKAQEDPHYTQVCVISPQWSDQIMLDWCGPEIECSGEACGQAWVRFTGMSPDPSVDPRAMKCVAVLTVTFDIGIGRCSATGDPGSNPESMENPSEDDYTADFLTGLDDLGVLQRAILCCSAKYRQYGLSIAGIVPFGPEGGCFGTAAVVTMQVTL